MTPPGNDDAAAGRTALPQADAEGEGPKHHSEDVSSEAVPFRCWGYPVAPAIFVLASLAMCVNAIQRDPRPSLAGLAVMAAGLPVYWWFRRKSGRAA